MAFLEVKNIYKSFGKTEVLKGVSFNLEKGEVLSVIGSSGNGKTTLLRCLNFLETPDSGEITVENRVIFPSQSQKNSKTANPLTFGMVFQNFNLFPQYSVIDNITLAMNVVGENKLKASGVKYLERKKAMRKIKEENRQAALSIIERVGLSEKINNYPCELSGGQQQRVAIARALALNPDILCFDEPTSALDPELTGEVLKVIKGLRDDNRTMIIVTHEMAFAKGVSDKVVFMAVGVIEEIGTPSQIFEQPKSEKLKSFLSALKKEEEV